MPIYEYICDECGQACELLLKSRTAKPKCPNCGSKSLSRQFSSFAAQAKGAPEPACPKAGSCRSGKCPMAM
jgi:putative FmdB family regulatory protein